MVTPEDILLEEVAFATKSLRSIRAGYISLQARSRCGGWRAANPELDDPRYVCAVFADGGHIPAPLILPVGGEEQMPDTLQGRIIGACRKSGILQHVVNEIRFFDLQYFGQFPDYYDVSGIIDQHLHDMEAV